MIEQLTEEAIILLQNLIEKPSFSSEEDETALLIMQWFSTHDVKFESSNHNVYAKNMFFDSSKPSILLIRIMIQSSLIKDILEIRLILRLLKVNCLV